MPQRPSCPPTRILCNNFRLRPPLLIGMKPPQSVQVLIPLHAKRHVMRPRHQALIVPLPEKRLLERQALRLQEGVEPAAERVPVDVEEVFVLPRFLEVRVVAEVEVLPLGLAVLFGALSYEGEVHVEEVGVVLLLYFFTCQPGEGVLFRLLYSRVLREPGLLIFWMKRCRCWRCQAPFAEYPLVVVPRQYSFSILESHGGSLVSLRKTLSAQYQGLG